MASPSPPPAKGDTRPLRDLGYVSWTDPYAALEDPSGVAFQTAVRQEVRAWAAVQRPLRAAAAAWKRLCISTAAAAIPEDRAYAEEQFVWDTAVGAMEVAVQRIQGHRLRVWCGGASTPPCIVNNFGMAETRPLYFTITDIGSGSEYLELAVYEVRGDGAPHRKCWSRAPVGPHAAFSADGTQIYALDVENYLRPWRVVALAAATGKHEATVYEATDPRFTVELYAPRLQPHVFVKCVNALSQRIGYITAGAARVHWCTPSPPADGAGTTLVPISADLYMTNTAIVHTAAAHAAVPLPENTFCVDACIATTAPLRLLVTTVRAGIAHAYLYDVAARRFSPQPLYRGKMPGAIVLHAYGAAGYTVESPNKSSRVYALDVKTGRSNLVRSMPEPLALPVVASGTVGPAHIPYTYVSHVRRPIGLIVEGYGAYGISARRGYPIQWLPWLARGYALAVACPRGGRENGDAWYDAARTAHRKHTTFEDTAAVIAAVQARFGHAPQKTLFYGRSAGGWLAAAIALHWPDRVGAVLAEVPYLDVLRTTSNPDLPLTKLEYDEFGNPVARPADFAALRAWSPMDTISVAPPAAPTLLVKTALHDVQVLPYEALKWAQRLRLQGWCVHVAIDTNGGHFAAQTALADQQAADAAFLDGVLQRRRARRYSCRNPRRSRQSARGSTRRRTNS